MSDTPSSLLSDREYLAAWRRDRKAERLRPLVERYLAFVYCSAWRRTGDAALAREATRALFLVLARRARWLRKKTVLAGWLFHVTAIACRKLCQPKRKARWRWFFWESKRATPSDAPLWSRVAPEIDAAIDRLPPGRRDAVLLRVLLNGDWESVARNLRTNERRARKRVESGLKKMTRRLRQLGVEADAGELAGICSANGGAEWAHPMERGCLSRVAPVHELTGKEGLERSPSSVVAPPAAAETVALLACEDAASGRASAPDDLAAEILASIAQTLTRRPAMKLARRTLRTLGWARWRRRVAVGLPSFVLLLAVLGGAMWYIDSRSGHSRLISMFLIWSVKHEGKTVPGLAQSAQPWPAGNSVPPPNAALVRGAADLYQTTNIWPAHLKFTREQWSAVQPKRIGALPHFLQPDGTVLLRHPEAQRSGLAGVLGFDFNWVSADLEIGGVMFTNVAARLKGNGTYLGSLYGDKHPFKVDLNKFIQGQILGGADELTFNNLVNDYSCLSDTLAYEFFRAAGLPASRTAFAYLNASVEAQWDRKPLGLYLMVEPVDEDFTLEHFGSRRVPVFKPVTYELFHYLGDEWSAYEAIYDLKTKATPEQLRRVIEFARLLTLASDEDFARRVGEFLDLEKFARHLACEVLLSNYDGFLSNGQNFYLYLDPLSNKFGFISWDLDLSWGGFFLLGTTKERERASIWHPWVGQHRLLERVMVVEEFRKLYRDQLEELFARLFVPNRLHQRIDELANVIRGPVAAESGFRLGKFERAVSAQRLELSSGPSSQGANRPAHQLKRFVDKRALSVREQLDGKSDGMILRRGGRR